MLNSFTAVSALRANAVALNTVANNIANANTPGYHKQSVLMTELPPNLVSNLQVGTGVKVQSIRRSYSELTERALTTNASELAASDARLATLNQIESVFTPGPGSLTDRTQKFFDELERLSANPGDVTQRGIVLRGAEALTDELHSSLSQLGSIKSSLRTEAEQLVRDLNSKADEIASLNKQIRIAEGGGANANDLRDRRDQLTNELAGIVDAELSTSGGGRGSVLLADRTLLIGEKSVNLGIATSPEGDTILVNSASGEQVSLTGGRLAGLFQSINEIVPEFENQLNEFSNGLIHQFNQTHATGVGASGPFEQLFGGRAVGDVTAPLAETATDFPIAAGELTVTVTDAATGERRNTRLTIDPKTQSLDDVAALLNGVDHLEATVNSTSRKITLRAETGFGFDFTGQLETTPDLTAVTGTSLPQLAGRYNGTANDTFAFTVVGTGNVGVTDGLSVEVRNGNGDLLNTLDLGSTYAPGTEVEVSDGVRVSFGAGTLAAGDTFDASAIANSDTTGVLSALGLNEFFNGVSASDIEVDGALLNDPRRLAAARSTRPGDNDNVDRLISLRDEKLLRDGTRAFEGFLTETLGNIGDQVRDASLESDSLKAAQQRITAEREAYSGIDPNEELVDLLKYQRAFEAASKTLSVMDELMRTTLDIVR
ncbi:MAG: flagellar hook-associated protein FlgK [Planctomycetales bacterium]|nr:flagellar hook-associated protein FlgK [Planctomycetales bacterium]